MSWITVFAIWFVLIAVFLIANKRWGDRMARLDKEQEQAAVEAAKRCAARHKAYAESQRPVSAGVRPYPE